MYCHKCGSRLGTMSNGFESCSHCGHNGRTTMLNLLIEKQNPEVCTVCRTENPQNAVYCQTCGYQLKKYTHCPGCGSRNISTTKDDFSLKNAVKGSLLGGLVLGPLAPLGIIAGAYIGSKRGKVRYHCDDCDYSWD